MEVNMKKVKDKNILTDSFGRRHSYLRISLIEKCNLRCTYCMPASGIPYTPKKNLMNSDEIFEISKLFVKNGVDKIRLTGGEPLLRKDFEEIILKVKTLGTKISLTSNAILIDRHIHYLRRINQLSINVSLDTLNKLKFKEITLRDKFDNTYENILKLIKDGFDVKINVVLMKGFNDNEIIDFIKFSSDHQVMVRFIEFMPFYGNKWDNSRCVSQDHILNLIKSHFGKDSLIEHNNKKNFIAREYSLKNSNSRFGIISTITNPFCDGCNRIRLTANGKIKNCLFSNNEIDILSPMRNGDPYEHLINLTIKNKLHTRAGMDNFKKLNDPNFHSNNRSMIAIGG